MGTVVSLAKVTIFKIRNRFDFFPHYTADTCCAEVALHSVMFCGLAEIARMIFRSRQRRLQRPSVTIVLIQVRVF